MIVEYYVVIKNAVQVLFKNTTASPLQINHASIPSVKPHPPDTFVALCQLLSPTAHSNLLLATELVVYLPTVQWVRSQMCLYSRYVTVTVSWNYILYEPTEHDY